MNTLTEKIELVLPLKAEYVSIARLTVSGIATRIGFDLETIEDIKVALSEICNKIVTIGSSCVNNYILRFLVTGKELTIVFLCDDDTLRFVLNDGNDEFTISIVTAFMDSYDFSKDRSYILSMTKSLEGKA